MRDARPHGRSGAVRVAALGASVVVVLLLAAALPRAEGAPRLVFATLAYAAFLLFTRATMHRWRPDVDRLWDARRGRETAAPRPGSERARPRTEGRQLTAASR